MSRHTHHELVTEPLNEFFQGFFRPMRGLVDETLPRFGVDLVEKEDGYELSAELPGFNKDDIAVEIDGATVSIKAQREAAKDHKDGEKVLRRECYRGEVRRTITLEYPVDDQQAKATYENGLLKLDLPKKSGMSHKRLAIS